MLLPTERANTSGRVLPVVLMILLLAGGAFLYGMYRFQESPRQFWERIARVARGSQPEEVPPAASPTPMPAPTAMPAPVVPSAPTATPEPTTTPSPEPTPDALAYLIDHPDASPGEVVLVAATDFQVSNGASRGTMHAKPGTRLKITGIRPRQVAAALGGVSSWIPIEATDLAERAPAAMEAHRERLARLPASRAAGSPAADETVDSTVVPTPVLMGKSPLPLLVKPDPSKVWKLDKEFSDEFNGREVDSKKWNRDLAPWGDRAWSADNVWQENGSLFIRARRETHTDRKGQEYFYKLGILQSRAKTTYGFFEARLKGCSRFPGLCPAFWLYSTDERNSKYPEVAYCEIDIVEMLQGLYDPVSKRKTGPEHIDMNLHCRVIKDGKEVWRRPNDWPEVCRHSWDAPWDPREGFHVYACENTPEKITWFIDGKKVAEEKNLLWHLPMIVTLTMELRPPLIDWAGVDGRVPVPNATSDDGFPTSMEVDYVRSWTREK